MYREYNQCSIRKAAGGEFGTFDLNGRLVPSSDLLIATLGIGLNWTGRTTWAAGSAIYKI